MDYIEYDSENVPVAVNGKPVAKSFQNAYREAMKTDYFKKYGSDNIVYNSWSGAPSQLTPLETTIYQWVKAWEQKYNHAVNRGIFPITKVTQAPVQAFDNMRYFFSSINQSAYMELLD